MTNVDTATSGWLPIMKGKKSEMYNTGNCEEDVSRERLHRQGPSDALFDYDQEDRMVHIGRAGRIRQIWLMPEIRGRGWRMERRKLGQ